MIGMFVDGEFAGRGNVSVSAFRVGDGDLVFASFERVADGQTDLVGVPNHYGPSVCASPPPAIFAGTASISW